MHRTTIAPGQRLRELLPGDDPARLVRLFDVFPEPLRSDAVDRLRRAGLVPAGTGSMPVTGSSGRAAATRSRASPDA
jgi:hypothetical protein